MASIEAIYIIDIYGKIVLDYPITTSPPSLSSLIPYVINQEDGSVLSATSETFRQVVEPSAISTTTNYAQLIQEYQSKVQPPIIEVSSSLLLFHQKYGNIIFLLPCASTTPALLPFEFIARVIETFEAYLEPPLIPTKIETNFPLIATILSEMIDGGVPLNTEPDSIKDFVPNTGAISKLISTATSAANAVVSNATNTSNVSNSSSNSSTFGSTFGSSSSSVGSGNTAFNAYSSKKGFGSIGEIPWRHANVRHSTNELFVDIIETINVIIPPTKPSSLSSYISAGGDSALASKLSSSAYYSTSAKPTWSVPTLFSKLDGSIFISSKLSGVPEINLALNTGKHKLLYPSFHPCVRYEKFEHYSRDSENNSKTNTSTLRSISSANAPAALGGNNTATFSFIPPDGKFLLASYSIDDSPNIGLCQADLRTGLGANKNEFEVRVWTLMSKETQYIENLTLNIVSNHDGDNKIIRSFKPLRVSTGDYTILGDGTFVEWKFGEKTPLGWNATLRGILLVDNNEELEEEEEETKETQSNEQYDMGDEDLYKPRPPKSSKKKSKKHSSKKKSHKDELIDLDDKPTNETESLENDVASLSIEPSDQASTSNLVDVGETGSVQTSSSKEEAKTKKSKKKSSSKKSSKKKKGVTIADDQEVQDEDGKIIRYQSPVANALSSAKKTAASGPNSKQRASHSAVFPTHVSVSYKATGQVPSGIKVQTLKINNTRGSSDQSKPFKGVRYVTLTGDYIVR